MKITDSFLAQEMNMTQQSFARWKDNPKGKSRPEVYNAIRCYYELKEENKMLKAKLTKYEKLEAILKEEN